MVRIETKTTLERFRRFLIYNTCKSFIPSGYLNDPSVFPERDASEGLIYVEALSKIDLGQIRNVKFVKVAEVLGVIYRSKSGNTDLKWRQMKGVVGKITGEASPNSIVNMIEAGVLPKNMVMRMLKQFETTSNLKNNIEEKKEI
ncbi:MAG: hypothetical protein QW655_00915 [Nitrososphaerota archaeon]